MNFFVYLYENLYRRIVDREKFILERLDPLIHKGRILDVGCSHGRLSFELGKRKKVKIVGVDILVPSHTYIPVKKYKGDVLPFRSKSFDLVLLIDTLHHSDNPAILLKEAKRVGKKIIIKDHYYENLKDFLILRFHDWAANVIYGRNVPFNFLEKCAWKSLFKSLGLKLLYEERFKYPRSPIKQIIFEVK